MDDATVVLVVLGVVVVLFVWNRLPVEVVALGSSLSLYAVGILSLDQALSGFGDPAVILIAALFVVSEALDATGVTTWLGQKLVDHAGEGSTRLLVMTMLLSAVLTALIGLNGAVAALLPMAVVMAMRRGLAPSRLLMPLAFAGSAGGLLLLTGSPVNVVISQAANDAGVGAFGFLEFALVGLPLVLGTLAIVVLFGSRLLPVREDDALPRNLSDHASTLVHSYSLDNVAHLRVNAASSLLGTPRDEVDLSQWPGLRVITVLDSVTSSPVSQGPCRAGDRLTVVGEDEMIEQYATRHALDIEARRVGGEFSSTLMTRDSGAAEVVIPPRSVHVGRTVRPSQVLEGSLVVLAVVRSGEDQGAEPTRLEAGDTLLVEGPWSALGQAEENHEVLVVDSPELLRRQSVPMGRRSGIATGVLAAMVVMLATGIVPAVVATLLAAAAMVLLRAVTMQQAYRGVAWTTVLMVAGMIPLSTAVQVSGAGERVAELLVALVDGAGPRVLLLALFVVTVAFGQLISNTATALIMIPVALSAAEQLEVSPQPVLMSLCVAAAVAFLTPVSTPANMMVMGPAGYRFGDYWRLGLPLVVLFGVVSVLLVPVLWPF